VVLAECGASECGDLIGDFTPSLMECVFKTFGPLGAVPYFSYS
jgi:uncharacterized protein YmfQ (DUF2313 family)